MDKLKGKIKESLQSVLPITAILLILSVVLFPLEIEAVAFDSGGVTAGPMTVPFIMALGIGLFASRSDKDSAADSFGLIAFSSVGPILAVFLVFQLWTKNYHRKQLIKICRITALLVPEPSLFAISDILMPRRKCEVIRFCCFSGSGLVLRLICKKERPPYSGKLRLLYSVTI